MLCHIAEKQSREYKNGADLCTWPWVDTQGHWRGKRELKNDKHGTFLNYKTVLYFQYRVCVCVCVCVLVANIEKSWKINSKVRQEPQG